MFATFSIIFRIIYTNINTMKNEIISHITKSGYGFNYEPDNSNENTLSFACRKNGNVLDEQYSEIDMFDMIKQCTDKIGMSFDSNTIIKRVCTEFPKEYSKPYYYAIGIETIDENDNVKFIDVYSLTMYYLENVLKLMSK